MVLSASKRGPLKENTFFLTDRHQCCSGGSGHFSCECVSFLWFLMFYFLIVVFDKIIVELVVCLRRFFLFFLLCPLSLACGAPLADSSQLIDFLGNVQRIYTTSGSFAAVLGDGQVICWGDPLYGGDGLRIGEEFFWLKNGLSLNRWSHVSSVYDLF